MEYLVYIWSVFRWKRKGFHFNNRMKWKWINDGKNFRFHNIRVCDAVREEQKGHLDLIAHTHIKREFRFDFFPCQKCARKFVCLGRRKNSQMVTISCFKKVVVVTFANFIIFDSAGGILESQISSFGTSYGCLLFIYNSH